jgi:hypothetical protein
MNIRTLVLASAFLALGIARADAALPFGSAPLFVADGDDYECTVVNLTDKEIASVTVRVILNSGSNTSGAVATCAPLAPHAVCKAVNSAASNNYRYCSGEGSSKALRGNFCNLTSGECTPLR